MTTTQSSRRPWCICGVSPPFGRSRAGVQSTPAADGCRPMQPQERSTAAANRQNDYLEALVKLNCMLLDAPADRSFAISPSDWHRDGIPEAPLTSSPETMSIVSKLASSTRVPMRVSPNAWPTATTPTPNARLSSPIDLQSISSITSAISSLLDLNRIAAATTSSDDGRHHFAHHVDKNLGCHLQHLQRCRSQNSPSHDAAARAGACATPGRSQRNVQRPPRPTEDSRETYTDGVAVERPTASDAATTATSAKTAPADPSQNPSTDTSSTSSPIEQQIVNLMTSAIRSLLDSGSATNSTASQENIRSR